MITCKISDLCGHICRELLTHRVYKASIGNAATSTKCNDLHQDEISFVDVYKIEDILEGNRLTAVPSLDVVSKMVGINFTMVRL